MTFPSPSRPAKRTGRDLVDPEHAERADYVQRMSFRDWRSVTLAYEDYAIFEGKVYDLVATNVGNRVLEVRKGPDASNFRRLRGLDYAVPPQSNALPSPEPERPSPLVET